MATVLIVDDEPQVARALARTLRRAGFTIQVAASGDEALAALSGFTPDVVISDFRMPGMTGAELLAEVKRRLPLTLRLILSGHADLGSILKSINEGEICRFLSKPWDDHELVALLRKLLVEKEVLTALYHPFRAMSGGASSDACQSESKVSVKLRQTGEPLSRETIIELIGRFAGTLEQSQVALVGGLLHQHSGTISFVAEVGAAQQLTLEIPVSHLTASAVAS